MKSEFVVQYLHLLPDGEIHDAHLRPAIRDALERHLRHEPKRVSKSRIKRLRGLSRPQYRLRVGEIRVYYDVSKEAVEVLAIISKAQSEAWLREAGESI